MIKKNKKFILERSRIIDFILSFHRRLDEEIYRIYSFSILSKSIVKSKFWMKEIALSSFFGRLSEINVTKNGFFKDSIIITKIIKIVDCFIRNLDSFRKRSFIVDSIKKLSSDFKENSLRIIGGIFVTSIIVNALIIFLLEQKIHFWGLVLRLALFFIGLLFLFCRKDFNTVCENSLICKKLRGIEDRNR